jgi:uncharacterized coiled-coil DUF342 family protein
MRITFDEVSVKGVRRWKDAAGKWHQETKKFFQTLNPFNKAADGSPKSYEQIRAEIRTERDAWMAASLAPPATTEEKD